MNEVLRSLKRGERPILDGITITQERRDSQLHAVTFTDAQGHVVKIALQSYCLVLLVPQEPEKVKKEIVHGEIAGVKVREEFDDAFQAHQRQRELEGAGATVETVTEEVEVPF